MSARDAILAAARRNAPPATPLPPLPSFEAPTGDVVVRFIASAEAAGARVVTAADAQSAVREAFPDAHRIVSTSGRLAGTAHLEGRDVAEADLFVCEAAFGVAENGAVWIPESAIGTRVAPFLAPHVVVLLNTTSVVPTMHEAYARLGPGDEGFGVFVAGPSKTADIEQSLVVGAHGPLSLTVVLLEAQA